jgi:hypothetical protein
MDMILGAILFLGGYLLCYFTQKPKTVAPPVKKQVETVVKDFKNPLERYKKVINADGLYSPQKPRRGVKDNGGNERRKVDEG